MCAFVYGTLIEGVQNYETIQFFLFVCECFEMIVFSAVEMELQFCMGFYTNTRNLVLLNKIISEKFENTITLMEQLVHLKAYSID